MAKDHRNEIIDIVKKEFIGPDPIDWPGCRQENGEEILTGDPPRSRYIAGILFPRDTSEEITSEIGENELNDIQLDQEDGDFSDIQNQDLKTASPSDYMEEAEELINRSNAYRQSAMSITAAVREGDSLSVEISAGTYLKVNENNPDTGKVSTRYFRVPIPNDNKRLPLQLPLRSEGMSVLELEGTKLKFDVIYRYKKGNTVVYTFTLENTISRPGSFSDEDCYFQVSFKLISALGFSPLPTDQKINVQDEDYQSNMLLYRDVLNYAIGHGCASEWEESEGKVLSISTSIFPSYEVKAIVPAKVEGVNLNMLDYAPGGDFEMALSELNLLCERYEEWIDRLEEESLKLDDNYSAADFQATAKRHINNCKSCLARMREGVKLLKTNENVRTAFQYMNLAMLMQQLHYNLPLRNWKCNEDDDFYLDDLEEGLPDPYNESTWYGDKNRYGKWRPFQLAFILMNLRSMLERDCSERKLIDLIWFPTGGGKTEAYLGLSAYTIFIRRLMNRDDSGTAILMRYTLRLLTAQQYERAAAMICACDVLRREREDLFGKSRITIGLWVGVDTTPNNMEKAVEIYNKLYASRSEENPFIILKCPWCGAQMGPVQNKHGSIKVKGYSKNVGAHKKKSIIYKCSNPECTFSDKAYPLPLQVVDEAIYENPPTLLLGTVDKFAMLPFRPQAQSIFGYRNGEHITAPDLIIQDELHLISGPLGSMVGHYETMINELCTISYEGRTVSPKIIASTATISHAKEQCRDLFGCEMDQVIQFPPSGLSAKDSFFAIEDRNQNGREYVGIMANGSPSDATTAIRLFAALLFAAKEIGVSSESERDPYWTNIGYYNSLRELGQARTWIRADIDEHLDSIYKRKHYDQIYKKDEYRKKRRYIWRDEELTSRIQGDKVTASLANLNIQYKGRDYYEMQSDEVPIDICLATNMISVGLDVQRLGLMTVAGQPKTTSEYIQATSRVGRDGKNAPGLVFVLYRPGRPRDKSHYEHFVEYHSRLYCNVEPTSVTPFSAPVRERALHAIIIGILRLEGKDDYNSDPPGIPDKHALDHVAKVISERVIDVDKAELDATMKLLAERMQEWEAWHPAVWDAKTNRNDYFTNDVPLIYGTGKRPNKAWGGRGLETPTSMRSADATCEVELMNSIYRAKED